MRDRGIPEVGIDAYLNRKAENRPVEVLECNWNAVQVLMRCRPSETSDGLAPSEIRAACSAFGFLIDGYLVDAVQFLGSRIRELRRS